MHRKSNPVYATTLYTCLSGGPQQPVENRFTSPVLPGSRNPEDNRTKKIGSDQSKQTTYHTTRTNFLRQIFTTVSLSYNLCNPHDRLSLASFFRQSLQPHTAGSPAFSESQDESGADEKGDDNLSRCARFVVTGIAKHND